MSNFITFGCWNKGNCNPDPSHAPNNSLSKVIAKMDSYIHTLGKKPAFVCVAGDNYYPEVLGKGKDKKKHLSIPDLRSGFECLSEFQKRHHIPIDIIAGNHDTENTGQMNVIPGSPTLVDEPCIITKAEIQASSTMNFTMFNYRIIGNTLVIMIDSTIYEENLEDPVELNCYAIFLKHTLTKLRLTELHDKSSPITHVSQLKAIQRAWLGTMYESIGTHEFANVVIVAHHPLASYKIKNEECRFPIVKPDYLDFCYEIYTHLRESNSSRHFFYSCADLHTYQSGTVTIHHKTGHSITISQEIAGTGGTGLELEFADIEFKCPSLHETGLVEYRMTKINHNHGFLHWSIDSGSGNLSATFIPIDSVSSESGSGSGSGSARDGGTKRRRQRASKRRNRRTSKRRSNRQRRIHRSRSRSRSRH